MRYRRVVYLALFFGMFVSSYPSYVDAQTAPTFSTNLSLGSSGAQVLLLQRILNESPDTQIASAGPGSPGNETGYFGALTSAAVMRFQEKYTSQILTPAGLTQANGFVGSYTRAVLNTLTVAVVNTTSVTVTPPIVSSSTSILDSQNPNLKHVDAYIAAIQAQGLKEGMSPNTLALIEQKIRKDAATTTDFTQEFYNQQKALYEKRVSENTAGSPVLAFFEKALSLVAEPFAIQKAYAGIGLPFGGYITYSDPIICDCPGGVTQLFVNLPNVVPPQVSNLILNYEDGTEAFSNYNIPEPSIAVLGAYVPGIQTCWTIIVDGCVVIPSQGQIQPEVGSSLAP